MSEDRETHEIVTPLRGHVVECKDWINGREKQKIDGAMFKSIRTVGTGENLKPTMSETMLAGQENASIEAIVVSVDGSSTDVLNRVLDMRVKDFEFVVKHVEKIVEGDFDEKKETDSETNTIESSEQVEAESPTLVSP
jgi:hypothetical protein